MVRSDNPWMRYKGPSQEGWVHADLGTKAGFAQQMPCRVCEPLPSAKAQSHSFPISVPPFTKQNHSIQRKVHAQVVAEMEKTADRRADPRTWEGLAICATVVAVQADDRNVIDADNAAKAILDTLQNTVILNDKAIQHVSSFRMQAPASATKGYYLISLSPVYPLEVDVVDRWAPVKDGSLLMGLQAGE